MKPQEHENKQDQLEAHSLPGTNQAGKEAPSCEDAEREDGARDRSANTPDTPENVGPKAR